MDRFTAAMGEGDEDVMNLKAGIAGLVFENWSDDQIQDGIKEMVIDARADLVAVFEIARKGKNDKEAPDGA